MFENSSRTGGFIDVQGGFPHGTEYELTVNAWPTLKSTAAPTDTDKDGINDEEDKCPLIAGVKENNGCPAEIKAAVKAKVDMAAKNIFFEFASATIQERSFASLDEVVTVLNQPSLQKIFPIP